MAATATAGRPARGRPPASSCATPRASRAAILGAVSEPRAWIAGPDEAAAVATLLIAFRDWYGRDEPPDATFHAGVERLIARDDTDYVLAAADGGGEPGGVCQL